MPRTGDRPIISSYRSRIDSGRQDWSEILKGVTPEAVAKVLLQPR